MRKKWRPAKNVVGEICICPICHAYRVGSTTDELAEAYRLMDARPILDLLAEHGTPIRTGPWQKMKRPTGAPLLAVLLLLATSLALQSPVAAKGRPSIPGLAARLTHEQHRARDARKVEAERAYSTDPLGRLEGGHLLEIELISTEPGRWTTTVHANGTVTRMRPSGLFGKPESLVTTDGRRWRFGVWTKPGQKIEIVVLEEFGGER